MIWQINPAHSSLTFALPFLRGLTTRGRFTRLRGRIYVDEAQPSHSWVEAEVEAASIDTRNRLRDAHLRSAAFFAVKPYPRIAFESTQVEQISQRDYRVTGHLTLRGVRRPITFEVTYQGQNTVMGSRAAFLTASAKLNRHDFGLSRGRLAAGALVRIELELELVPQAALASDPRRPSTSRGTQTR